MAADNTTRIVLSAVDNTSGVLQKVQTGLGGVGSAAMSLRGALSGIGAAGAVTYLTSVVRQAAQAGQEIDRLSTLSNTGAETFQEYAYAAQRFGISQEKLADIFKDTQDKVGDFLQNGGGPLKDFFDNVAPKVGVTADQFRRLSGPEALQLYVSSLEKANLTQSELTFYMEAIASDSAMLLPLLKDNGRAFNDLAKEARDLGVVMDDEAVASAKRFNEELGRLETSAAGFGRTVAMPIIDGLNLVIDQFKLARKYSDGWFESLFRTGTGNAEEKLKSVEERLAGLLDDRQRLAKSGTDLRGIDQAIASAAKDVNLLKDFLRQSQASRVKYGEDDQSAAEARRLGISRPSVSRNPAAGPKPSKKSGTSGFSGLTYDEQITQRVGQLFEGSDITRAKEYSDTLAKLDELFYSGAIGGDLYDSAVKKLTGSTAEAGAATTRLGLTGPDAKRATEDFGASLHDDVKNALSNAFRDTKNPLQAFGDALYNVVLTRVTGGLANSIADGLLGKGGGGGGMLSGVSDWFSNLLSFDGGGYTGTGSRAGGMDGRGGFLAMLHPNETVVDHTKGQSAGGSVTVQIINNGQPMAVTRQQESTGADGGRLIQITAEALATDVAAGSGPLARAIEGRYGLRTSMA